MITPRDKKAIEFIEKFKIASTSTLQTLFYVSERVAQRRLTLLTEHKELKRTREHISKEYLYYIKKPKQLKHMLLLTDFYREVVKAGIEVIAFENEVTIFEGLRPDGFITYSYNGNTFIAFIEVHISNNKLDLDKYKRLLKTGAYKKVLPIFPKLIVITNKNIPESKDFKILQISEEMGNINNLI